MHRIVEQNAAGPELDQFVGRVGVELTEGRRSAADAALYARPSDPLDLAAQILKLLDSEFLRRELGARGRKRIEEEFNWESDKRALLAAYDMAIKNPR